MDETTATIKNTKNFNKEFRSVNAINLHIFADESEKASCAVTIAVVEQGTRKGKGVLTSKSRIFPIETLQ